jgi:transposase
MVARQFIHPCQPCRRRGAEKGGPTNEPSDHALGRSRGGFGTKLHLLVDGNGLPLSALLLPGAAHESTQFEALVDSVQVQRRVGRPRRRPRRIGGDKAYHAQRIRHWLRAHGIGAVIPPRRSRGKRRRGRPVSYDPVRYRDRNVVERCLGWLKECRALATRFEKLAVHFLGLVHLAIIERYLRILTRMTSDRAAT